MVPDREILAWVTQPPWLHQFHFGWTMNRMAISFILDELWTEWPSVPFWMNYEQNDHQFHFGWTMNRVAISSILDELWTEWPSVPFWMNYEQSGHQFHFGWTMDRTVIKLLWLHQIHFGWIVDRTTTISSILDELCTEQPSVPFWMNYRQNDDWTSMTAPVPFWMNYRQHDHQFLFGWNMDRMVISSILDELWTEWPPVPFWINWCSHAGSFTLVAHFFSSNSWSFNPGLKIESGFTYQTTRASALTHVYWTIN